MDERNNLRMREGTVRRNLPTSAMKGRASGSPPGIGLAKGAFYSTNGRQGRQD
jgi:hypothetical protein